MNEVWKTACGFVVGSIAGSFAAAVADRSLHDQSVVHGRSQCRECHRRIAIRDVVPILSWCRLRGRCRWCHRAIGIESLVAEALGAVLCALVTVRIDRPLVVVSYWILCTGLMALVIIDIRSLRLPRRITYWTAALGIPLMAMEAVRIDQPERISAAVVGGALALLGMGVLYLVSRGSLGDGDVRLSPLLGMYLGWTNTFLLISGFFLAFVLGAMVGVMLMVAGRAGRRSALPFGPFLAIGTVIALLFEPHWGAFGPFA